MRSFIRWIAVAAPLVLAACGDEQASPGPGAEAALVAAPAAAPASAAPAPGVKMPAAKQAFLEVMQLVQDKYVDAEIDSDALWSGAAEGVLRRLLQVKDPRVKINTLLDPQTVKEMKLGLGGRISGAGMVIKVVEGMVLVRHVIPAGPADRAGVRTGDRLLAVDGKPLRDLELDAIVALIRGETGSTVKLFMQRETREWEQPVVRGAVILPAVSHLALARGVGYLRVSNFNKRTAAQLDGAVAELTRQGTGCSLVLDLRGSPGGLLETAIAVADRFLPAGATVVSLRRRSGAEEVHRASGAHPGDRMPVVVLVNGATASGAEIVAAALRDNGRASVVGEPTMGKGTVESIIRLKNDWALKLSVARFYTPRKTSLQGRGIRPDFAIPGAAAEIATYAEPPDARRLAADPQVQAALHLLALGR